MITSFFSQMLRNLSGSSKRKRISDISVNLVQDQNGHHRLENHRKNDQEDQYRVGEEVIVAESAYNEEKQQSDAGNDRKHGELSDCSRGSLEFEFALWRRRRRYCRRHSVRASHTRQRRHGNYETLGRYESLEVDDEHDAERHLKAQQEQFVKKVDTALE